MPSRKQAAIGVILGCVALVVALGALFGSPTGAGTESFNVQGAPFIGYPAYALNDDNGVVPVIVAVNTPTGPHTELLGGNFEVTSFRPAEWQKGSSNYDTPVLVHFENLGDGFYRIDVAPGYVWDDRQYVLMVTVRSGRGAGVAVVELPMAQTKIGTYEVEINMLPGIKEDIDYMRSVMPIIYDAVTE